jgi:hypothetical protein
VSPAEESMVFALGWSWSETILHAFQSVIACLNFQVVILPFLVSPLEPPLQCPQVPNAKHKRDTEPKVACF